MQQALLISSVPPAPPLLPQLAMAGAEGIIGRIVQVIITAQGKRK